MDSSDDYSDSSEIEFTKKRKPKKMSKRQQVIDNFMNGILDPDYICKPNKKKPGAFIVSKRKTPLKIQDSNAPVKVDAPGSTPNPVPEKLPDQPASQIDFSKYIANQETVNNNFNSTLTKLCTTLEKIEKSKAKRKQNKKVTPKKEPATPPKEPDPTPQPEPQQELSQISPQNQPEPEQESSDDDYQQPQYYQQPFYYPQRRMRPRDYINFLA